MSNPTIELDAEFIEPDEPSISIVSDNFDEPDEKLLDEPKRSVKAKAYEKKVRGFFRTGFWATVSHEATVPDAAAILVHAPKISEKVGDLADADPRIAKGIDFLTEGTENPYLAAIAVGLPFALQILRNHEPQLVPAQRGIRIPFTQRRINFKFGIKLGRLRVITSDPHDLSKYVFENDAVKNAMKKASDSR